MSRRTLLTRVGLCAAFISLTVPSLAGFDFDDDLFGDDMIEDIEDDGQDRSRDLLVSDEVEIGGRMRSSFGALWGWESVPGTWEAFTTDGHHGVWIGVGADVFLDARPADSLRVFAKVRTDYPFSRDAGPVIEVFELFTDLNWRERVFFRAGKQTVTWGDGYYWSPADVLSLVPIDVDDPDADREGPLALKASVPFGRNHVVEGYIVGDDTVRAVRDLGVASRAIFYLPPVEVSLGAAYQRENPFRIVSSVTLPAGDVSAFGEGRLSFGRDGRLLRAASAFTPGEPPYTLQDDEDVYLSGTLGVRWVPDQRNIVVIAQYLYHAEGYTDVELLPLAALAVATGDLQPETIPQFGRHHSMLTLMVPKVVHENVSAGVQWQAAWIEPSGLFSATVGWRWFEITGGLHYAYGDAPSEFGGYLTAGQPTFRNPYGRLGASLTLRIGGGRF